ncbi:radical SAM protein [Paenibacillus oralis]|uniref:Radical SAM protein n=1 Tax=Paenibacillus oralis TaxID=2490856 RepID=A0A3P3U2J8_9BACL|nr:radical SAM protein [Paenibacillus oralis]RRJ64096.1 radical SAM protein [Paenibacillus oralis]
MKHRVTMRFTTRQGNSYLYDDVTSMIFPWSGMLENILKLLETTETAQLLANIPEEYAAEEWIDKVHWVDYWKNNLGAFYREEWKDSPLSYDNFEAELGANLTNQLILSVTDDCNLRCKYCIYSDEYALTKNKTCNYMSTDTAQKAIDYFHKLIAPQLARNPRKKFGITFYGGEPLVNFTTVKYAVEYAREKLGDKVYFMMTSNGLLLTDEVVNYLKMHDVGLAISIDGPEQEHDRLRVTVGGGGSFARIKKNVDRIREKHPEYYRTRVNAVCVYDFLTDVEQTEQFFEDGERDTTVPRAIFVNRVSDTNSCYYQKFSKEDIQQYHDREKRLRDKYFSQKTCGCSSSSYLTSLIGSSALSIITRRRALDGKPAYMPATGSCVPGQKLCVNSNGVIDICERVNGTNPIGDVHAGLHTDRVIQMVSNFRENIAASCDKCPGQKLCGLCFVNFETEGAFRKQKEICANHLNVMRNNLSLYTSICEDKPDAEFIFSSDTIELDQPLTTF